MKVLITKIVSLNPGDAAILEGSLRLLRNAFGDEVDVTVFDKNGDAAAKFYPWARFRRSLFVNRPRRGILEAARRRGYAHRVRLWDSYRLPASARLARQGFDRLAKLIVSREEWDSLREYLQADLIISSGGTYLVEHYDMLPSILDYELTLALGKPLAFFPQSLGPFEKTRYRGRLRRIFEAASLVMIQDEQSASHIRDLGVSPQEVRVYPDATYEFKTRELFRGLGLEEWVTDIDDTDPAGFERLIDHFVGSLSDLKAVVRDRVMRLRQPLSRLPIDLRCVLVGRPNQS